jgi:type VI secretion system protein ImpF
MLPRSRDNTVTPSLLDRLTDLDPDNESEPAATEWSAMRDFKASLARDLAALLNTRRKEVALDPDYVEVGNSVLTYGIPDYTSYTLTNGVEQELVRRSIERAIRQFEPRLSRVAVVLAQPDPATPTLTFQIDAVLKIDDEPVAFDVRLHRDSRRMSVAGGDR